MEDGISCRIFGYYKTILDASLIALMGIDIGRVMGCLWMAAVVFANNRMIKILKVEDF